VLHRALAQAVRWECALVQPCVERDAPESRPGRDPAADPAPDRPIARGGTAGRSTASLLSEARGLDRSSAEPAPRSSVGRRG
jgi:hypothetical protein